MMTTSSSESMALTFDRAAGQNEENEAIERRNGIFEEHVKVDRRKFETLIEEKEGTEDLESAERFFTQVMEETGTEISWPSRLKPGTKSRKDPHIRVSGSQPDSVASAKRQILSRLDGRRDRVTLKMDVAFTDHSHIIGKGGRSIQRVMDETGCHIHFPDSNRTSVFEKSNQVSIAGSAIGAEQARCRIRELLPLVFKVDLPANRIPAHALDTSSVAFTSIQSTYGVSVNIRYSASDGGQVRGTKGVVTVSVRGSRTHLLALKQGLVMTLEHLVGHALATGPLAISLSLDIAVQHHSFVSGRAAVNVRAIMQQTGAVITFPAPAGDVQPLSEMNGSFLATATGSGSRKSTVVIKGNSFDSVYYAWQELVGYLPLILIFDLKEGQEVEPNVINGLMEQWKVSILLKPKPKQSTKSVMIRGTERESNVLFEVRRSLLGLASEPGSTPSCDQDALHLASKLFSLFMPYYSQLAAPVNGLVPGTPVPCNVLQALLMRQQQQTQPQKDMFKHYFESANCSRRESEETSPTSSNASLRSSENRTPPTPNPMRLELANATGGNLLWAPKKSPNYEEIRLNAARAILGKEVDGCAPRTPTNAWSGHGFSQSMPENALKAKLQAASMLEQKQQSSFSGIWCENKDNSPPFDYHRPLNVTRYLNEHEPLEPDNIKTRASLELGDILSHLGLSQHLETFQRHDIDLEIFRTLNDADLQELGIAYFGRRKLVAVITELKTLKVPSAPSVVNPTVGFQAAVGAERRRQGSTQNPLKPFF